MRAWHWRASIRHVPRFVNIPYGPHRILVIGWGRLDQRGVFHPHQFCCYPMTLRHCCPGRVPERPVVGGGTAVMLSEGGGVVSGLRAAGPLLLLAALAVSGCGGSHYQNCVTDLSEQISQYGHILHLTRPCLYLRPSRLARAEHAAAVMSQ